MVIALRDCKRAIKLSPMWLHSGWIDMVWRYRRTRIGPFWHTLSLGIYVIVMGVIWSAALKQDSAQYLRFVGTSIVVWSLISSFITEGTATLIAGESTALSMRFPYIAFTFQHVWRSLILFAHHFVLYFLIIIGTWHSPGFVAFWAIPGLLLVLANGVWMSLLAGIVSLRRRDFIPAISSVMQIAIFVTPVFWPKGSLGPQLAYAADFNPLYHLVTIVREPLLGSAPPLVSWAASFFTLFIGSLTTFYIYGRHRDHFAYWY
jgi:ABC-2 type transport system permease protein